MNPLLGLATLMAVHRALTRRLLVARVCDGDVFAAELRAQREDGVPPVRSFARLVPDQDGVLRLVLS